jgi:hypothetical protein
LIAFIIFTFFFILPFSIIPYIQSFKYPHEFPVYIINFIFIALELVFGFVVMCRFMKTQSAAFYLRTAPLIDKKFKQKYEFQNEMKSSREIAIGVRKHDKYHEVVDMDELDTHH